MARYVVRRLLWALFLFIAATVITYVIFFLIPGDPAQLACGRACTKPDVERVRHFLHLDQPVYQQYLQYVWNLVAHQDLGRSFLNRQSVNYLISQAAPVTASLVFGSAIFLLSLSLPIGV